MHDCTETKEQITEFVLDGADRPLEELREMKQLNTEKEAALKKVLTPAHFQQYLAAKDELRQRFEQEIMKGPAGTSQ